VSRILGIAGQTLLHLVELDKVCKLVGMGEPAVTPGPIEFVRLQAELAHTKLAHQILKKQRGTLRSSRREVRLGVRKTQVQGASKPGATPCDRVIVWLNFYNHKRLQSTFD
jgi:hypothetical protein